MSEHELQTVGELFAAPRRTGTHAEHRYVAVGVGPHERSCTFCRDCGYQPGDWWACTGEPKPPCEPDKYRPSWVIHVGRGGYVTREKCEEIVV
jgi:hypothetical protein